MMGAAFPDATIGKLPEEAEKLMQGACPMAARATEAREGMTRSEAPKRMARFVKLKESVGGGVEDYRGWGEEKKRKRGGAESSGAFLLNPRGERGILLLLLASYTFLTSSSS